MKTFLIIIIPGACLLCLGYFLRGMTNVADKELTKTQPVERSISRINRALPKAKTAAVIKLSQPTKKEGRRAETKDAFAIFELNSKELEAFIKGSKFDVYRITGPDAKLFAAAFARLTEINPAKAISIADTLSDRQKKKALDAVYKEWASSYPEEAMASAKKLKRGDTQETALRHIIKSVSADDPSRAFDMSIQYRGSYPTMYGNTYSVVSKMADENPLMALKKINTSCKGSTKEGLTKGLINAWAKNDPDEVSRYAEQIQNKSEKELFTKGLIDSFSSTDPDKSLALLNNSSVYYTPSDISGVASNLVKTHAPEVLEWIDSNYEGADREHIISTTLSAWSSSDGEAAESYYENLPESEFKTNLRQRLDHTASSQKNPYTKMMLRR